jgi:hypothetical protein
MVSIMNYLVKRRVCEERSSTLESKLATMKKEDRIGVRVSVELKKALIQVAKNEARSLAQVCEIFLREGALSYREDGAKFFQRVLARHKRQVEE